MSRDRYAQCDDTCTSDCGACKGAGRPHWSTDGAGAYIRHYYKVPAHIDGRVVVDGRPGVVVGFDGAYLLVQFDDSPATRRAHPTWHVDYELAAWEAEAGR